MLFSVPGAAKPAKNKISFTSKMFDHERNMKPEGI